jgi:hypothetical protein
MVPTFSKQSSQFDKFWSVLQSVAIFYLVQTYKNGGKYTKLPTAINYTKVPKKYSKWS